MHLIKLITIFNLSLFLPLLAVDATQTPIITWEKTEINFLVLPDEPFAQAIFKAYNNGDKRMRINHAYAESNAIKTVIKKRIIEPGESGTIEVKFFSEGKAAGIYHNKVNVFFEGHEIPLATLHYIVTIPKLIKCLPSMLIWDDSNFNEVFLVELELDQRFLSGLSSIDYDKSLYDVSLIPDRGQKSKYILKVAPIKNERPFNSLITIRASGPQITDAYEAIYLFNKQNLNK